MQETVDATTVLGLGGVFTLFFVTLGPLKIFGPFAQLTRDADETSVRKIAVLAFVLAVFAVVAGGFLGRALLQNWNISIPAMLLAGGIIFFLVGLNLVLEQYQPAHPLPPPLPAAPMAAAMRLTFPPGHHALWHRSAHCPLSQQSRWHAHREHPRSPDRGDGTQPAGDAVCAPDHGRRRYGHRAAGARRRAGCNAGRSRGGHDSPWAARTRGASRLRRVQRVVVNCAWIGTPRSSEVGEPAMSAIRRLALRMAALLAAFLCVARASRA